MYTDTISCVKCDGETSRLFHVDSGVRQGCVLAPDTFAVEIDRAVGRTAARAMFGASIGESSFSDFDFADDVAFLSELKTCYCRL